MIRRRPVEALLSKSARKRHLMELQTANARCEKCDNGARMCPSSSSYEPSDLLFSRTVAALLTVPPLISFSPPLGAIPSLLTVPSSSSLLTKACSICLSRLRRRQRFVFTFKGASWVCSVPSSQMQRLFGRRKCMLLLARSCFVQPASRFVEDFCDLVRSSSPPLEKHKQAISLSGTL